jgi:phenylalanyl-tRNA synthetase beta chain
MKVFLFCLRILKKGTAVADLFDVYADWIYEIGLTPNRMDAMSHIGVARDVCAWLSHHQNKIVKPKMPFDDKTEMDGTENDFEVFIENTKRL